MNGTYETKTDLEQYTKQKKIWFSFDIHILRSNKDRHM